MWRWLRKLSPRRVPRDPVLRPIVVPVGDPYRDDPSAPPRERTAEPRAFPDVLAALREADLGFRQRRRGFDLLGPAPRRMRVRIAALDQIVPEEMSCSSEAPELVLDLALALVPVFGPMVAEVRFAGAIVVDGIRDRRTLGEEAAERIQRVSRRVARRAPISVPILLDLARRMRQQR